MRMDRMEAKLENMDQSLNTQLARLTCLMGASIDASQHLPTDQIGKVSSSSRSGLPLRGLEKYRRFLRESMRKLQSVNAFNSTVSPLYIYL